MKLQKSSKRELKHISCGVLMGTALMLLVFAVLGRFDMRVLLGALLGAAAAILNFLFLCFCVQKAVNMGERAKTYMQSTYALRSLFTIGVMVVGFVVPQLNWLAVVIPVFLPRVTIFVMQLMGWYRPEPDSNSSEEEV